jgi:hypothetical protein
MYYRYVPVSIEEMHQRNESAYAKRCGTYGKQVGEKRRFCDFFKPKPLKYVWLGNVDRYFKAFYDEWLTVGDEDDFIPEVEIFAAFRAHLPKDVYANDQIIGLGGKYTMLKSLPELAWKDNGIYGLKFSQFKPRSFE